MDTPNTIMARHFNVINGEIIISPKEYYWHIPKSLRTINIKPGDVVRVKAVKTYVLVIVCKVLREEFEETNIHREPVIARISHAYKLKSTKYDDIIKSLEEALKLLHEQEANAAEAILKNALRLTYELKTKLK